MKFIVGVELSDGVFYYQAYVIRTKALRTILRYIFLCITLNCVLSFRLSIHDPEHNNFKASLSSLIETNSSTFLPLMGYCLTHF